MNNQEPLNPDQPTETNTAVTFQSRAFIQDNNLVISYQVTNNLAEVIYLVNRIFKWTADGLSLDPNLIYTEKDGEALGLAKAYLPVPEDLDVESPIVPYLTAVLPNETFSETISLALPITPYHPYDQISVSDQPVNYSMFKFFVGWIKSSEVDVSHLSQADGTALWSAEYDQIEAAQRLLETTLFVEISALIS